MNIHRLFEGISDPNFESIEKKKTIIDSVFIEEFETYVREYISANKKKSRFPQFDPSSVNFENYRFNLKKNGPNGLHKLESSHSEAIELRNDTLWQPFSKLSSRLGLGVISEYVNRLALIPVPDKRDELNLNKVLLRKLVAVPDSGFKTRIVAIPDFWTQLLMEPVRAHIQAVTKFCFPMDYRMDQSKGVTRMIEVQSMCVNKDKYCGVKLDIGQFKCYDISAWTDRFHHDLQKVVMGEIFSKGVAEVWGQLTVHCTWYISNTGAHIKYGQGQGMGTNGSFDIATLTDHLYIHFMYEREGKKSGNIPNFSPLYGKVGDDLWIYDIHNSYQEYCRKINLPINISKSKTVCKLGSIAEFCSRTAINGVDVSRVSPKVINRSSDFRNVPQLLSVCLERGLILMPSSFPSLNNIVKDGNETYFDKIQPWMVGAAVCNLASNEGSPYNSLTPKFMIDNGWLVDDNLKKVVSEPENLTRLLISQIILSILDSIKNIEVLTLSFCKTENKMLNGKSFNDAPLFSVDEETVTMVRKNVGFSDPVGQVSTEGKSLTSDILLPWEILPIIRLKTLMKALTEDLVEASSLKVQEVMDIHKFAVLLNRIARKVDFDGTNISYDSKKTYNRCFKIVKLLERTEPPFDCLVLDDSDQRDLINSIMSYEELPVEWVKEYLPRLVLLEEIAV
jgi:hypothetical protein